jgi:hypothetical protein
MRNVIWAVIACFALCGCEETTEYCDDACTIWAEDQCWGYDICIEECEDDGDWSKAYLKCLELADGCGGLEACG